MILEYRMFDRKYAVSIRLMDSSIHQVNTEIPEFCHHLTAAMKPLVLFLLITNSVNADACFYSQMHKNIRYSVMQSHQCDALLQFCLLLACSLLL